MKTFSRHIVFPVIFALVAVGAAFGVGWYQGVELNSGEDLVSPRATPPKLRMMARTNANANRQTLLTLDEAKAQLDDILAGNLPANARSAARAIGAIISKLKPADAIALIALLTDPAQRQAALRTLANEWERTDIKATLAWADTLEHDDKQFVLGAVLINFGSDPQIAAQYFNQLENPNAQTRTLAIYQIERGLARTDPMAALGWIKQVATGDELTKYTTDLFQQLAGPEAEVTKMAGGATMVSAIGGQDNPAAAVDLLSKITDPTVRSAGIAEIAKDWGATDPAAAAQWAATLTGNDSTAATAALNSIVTTWAKNDPVGALAFVNGSSDPSQFLADAPALAQSLSQYDPTAALSYVQNLPDGATKDQALNNVLVNLASTDFTDAWNFASGLPDGASRDAAMGSLVTAEAKIDPTQAANLLAQFPKGPALQSATRALAKTWAASDPQALSAWMQSLPAGNQRTPAIIELISAVATKDPASAMNWANTVTSPTTRANQVQRVANAWAKTDPDAALAALQSANITDEERAAMTQAVNQARAKAK
jgi:hypothetical protein